MAETGKANDAGRSENVPVSSNNQNRPLNKPRTYLFSKRGFGMAYYQKKFAYSV
jgi:hypothetical protein